MPKGFLPEFLQDVIELEEHILPDVTVLPPLFKETGVEIGPIPTGTPVNLLANLNMMPDDANFIERFTHRRKIVKLVIKIKNALKALPPMRPMKRPDGSFLRKGLPKSCSN